MQEELGYCFVNKEVGHPSLQWGAEPSVSHTESLAPSVVWMGGVCSGCLRTGVSCLGVGWRVGQSNRLKMLTARFARVGSGQALRALQSPYVQTLSGLSALRPSTPFPFPHST